MYVSVYVAPLLQPKQSRVRARRPKPNRNDVSLACYRRVSMSMLDHEVTVAESSTVLEHKQQRSLCGVFISHTEDLSP